MADRRIRLDLTGTVLVHLEHGRAPVSLRPGDLVPDGYEVSADLLAAVDDPAPAARVAAPAAVVADASDRGPQAGTVRTKTRRARTGDREELA